MKQMDVSIIIVNYNTRILLKNCIDSILKHTNDIIFEIIIVDNGSTDGSQEFIKQYFPEVILIESKLNLGFGKANNIAQKRAKGKYLFLLNSDTVLLNNAVKIFFEFFERYNKSFKIGALGGELLQSNGIFKTHSSHYFPKLTNEIKEICNLLFRIISKNNIFNIAKENFIKNDEEYIEVDYITGADLFILNEIIDENGFFDETFFMYYEETDFQKRLEMLGYKRLLINNTKIIHLEGASFEKVPVSGKKLIMIESSKLKYLKKHNHVIKYYLFRFIYLFITFPLIFDYRIDFTHKLKLLKIRLIHP